MRNMDTMRTADMEASIFGKYVNIVHDIEDEHFESDSVRTKMLHRFKSGKWIYLVAVCCVKVKPPTSDRSGTNFRESVGCLTCQVDPIRSST